MLDVILKRFEQPDDVRTFEKGKFEIVRIGNMAIGSATYQRECRWSLDVGPPSAQHARTLTTLAWFFPVALRPPSQSARSTNSALAASFTFRPGLPLTAAGLSARKPTCRFISRGHPKTPRTACADQLP